MTVASDLIQKLFDLGHFHNPAHMTGVTEANLQDLVLTDAVVKTAIQSYQEFFAVELDTFSADINGRTAIADGEIGPATERLFAMERCGYPDYSVEAANQKGSGSWPSGCHAQWPNNHSFTIQVNKAGMPAFLQAIFEDAFELVRQAYANIGIVFIREDDNNRANTLVTWQRGAGWIGLAIVPRSPRCGERIWARFDNRYRPSQLLDQWARLLAHEFGHNMGMSHSRGGIMNPSITSGPFTKTAWRGDPSEGILRRYFGGNPVNIGGNAPPTPTPPNVSDPVYFAGGFTLMQAGKPLGDYILVPKPKV